MLHLLSINISWVAYKLSYASSNRNASYRLRGISRNKQKKNPVVASYIAINNDKKQRESSASGGLFSVIAHYVLEKKGIVSWAVSGETKDVALKPAALRSFTALVTPSGFSLLPQLMKMDST